MRHIIHTSKEIHHIPADVIDKAKIYKRSDGIEWVFKRKTDADKAVGILINAGFSSVRRMGW